VETIQLLQGVVERMETRLDTAPDAEAAALRTDVAGVHQGLRAAGPEGLLARLLGDALWAELDAWVARQQHLLYTLLYEVARDEKLLARGCGDTAVTPHPFGCTVSHVMWELLFIIEDMAVGRRKLALMAARKMANNLISRVHKLEDWMGLGWGRTVDSGQTDGVYCSLTSGALAIGSDLLGAALGEEGAQVLAAVNRLEGLLMAGC
jgi:hypothetical protein